MKIIVDTLLPSHEKLILRYPLIEDAPQVTEYINSLSKEQTFVTLQGEEMSLEDEIKFLENAIEGIKKKKSVMLLAFLDNQLIGIAAINAKDRVSRHEGVLGISLSQSKRGQGLGKLLLSSVIDEAKRDVESLKMITLEVFATNTIAIKLYESLGFKEYGRLPGGIHYKGDYIDQLLMYRQL